LPGGEEKKNLPWAENDAFSGALGGKALLAIG